MAYANINDSFILSIREELSLAMEEIKILREDLAQERIQNAGLLSNISQV